jgi:hypothetical protein
VALTRLPGRAHDLTAARTRRIIRICERQGVPILADLAYQGGGSWVTTGIKRRPLRELTLTENVKPAEGRPFQVDLDAGVVRIRPGRTTRREGQES